MTQTQSLDISKLSRDEILERVRFLDTYSEYCESCWKILTKPPDSRYIPFKLNPAQARVDAVLEDQRSKRLPMRVKVLKYRQAGISTYASGRMAHWAATRPGCYTISIADKQDLPAQWLRRAKRWFQQTPAGLQTELEASNALELYFGLLESRYFLGSQAGQTPGMGYAIAGFHASEIANWLPGKFEEVMDDLVPSVPRKDGTIIIMESTGEVVGDQWFKTYHVSKRGDDDYAAVFLPWFIQPEYRDDDFGGDVLSLTEAERDIRRLAAVEYDIEVDDAMLAWRRAGISGDPYHGDEESFNGKFPSTEQEAFLSAGKNVFQGEQPKNARATVREPIWRGEILPKANPQQFTLDGCDGGRLLLWERPVQGMYYCIGADCQWGKRASTGSNTKESGSDYDAAYVQCVNTGKVVARWWGRADMGYWAKILASLGWMYRGPDGSAAVLAPERNSQAARGVIYPLLGLAGNNWRYPNLWVRSKMGKFGSARVQDYGWFTDEHSKADLIIKTKEALNNENLDFADIGAVEELESYIISDKQQFTAPPGMHDDRLMARMITYVVSMRMKAELLSRDMLEAPMDLSPAEWTVLDHIAKMDLADEGREEEEW